MTAPLRDHANDQLERPDDMAAFQARDPGEAPASLEGRVATLERVAKQLMRRVTDVERTQATQGQRP